MANAFAGLDAIAQAELVRKGDATILKNDYVTMLKAYHALPTTH